MSATTREEIIGVPPGSGYVTLLSRYVTNSMLNDSNTIRFTEITTSLGYHHKEHTWNCGVNKLRLGEFAFIQLI